MQDLNLVCSGLIGDLGWVDLSALTVVALFFLLGLGKGFVWQIGRVLALVGSYALAAVFGPGLAAHVFAGTPQSLPHLYLAYAVLFLLGFLALSAGVRLVHGLVHRAGLSTFDRLAGGLVGVGTGSGVVLVGLAVVLMFGQRFPVYAEVLDSRAAALGRAALDAAGPLVPEPVHAAFAPRSPAPAAVRPLHAHTPALDAALGGRDGSR
jgi:uncharacterized membrane protein required for colicin V production